MQLKTVRTVFMLTAGLAGVPFAAAQLPADESQSAAAGAPEKEADSAVTALVDVTVVEAAPAALAAHRTYLTAADMAASPARRLDDILLQIPSFSLFRRASSRVANPTTQGVTLRALAPSGTSRSLVVWDGMPLNDPFGGWVYWNRVPVLALDSVDVASGGLSSTWGSAALAGTVVLHSADTVRGIAEMGSGSQNQREATALSHSPVAEGLLSGGLQFVDSNGYKVIAPGQAGAIDVPAFAQYRSVWAGWRQQFGSVQWTTRGGLFAETRGNGTVLTGNNTDISWLQSRLQWNTGDHHWDGMAYVQDQEFASRFSAQAEDRNSETPALDQFSVPAQAVGVALRWQNRRWSGGVDGRFLDGESNERYFYSGGDFVNQRRAGARQQYLGYWKQYAWESDDWSLQGSARVDWVRNSSAFRREWNRESGEPRRDEKYPDREDREFSPRLDVVHRLDPANRVRFAAWRSFRAPTINERVRPFRVRSDITAANPELENEHLTGVDLGWSWQGRSAQGQLTVYWSQLEDAVANITLSTQAGVHPVCGFVPEGGSCRQRLNLRRVTAKGVEWSAAWQPTAAWNLGLGLLLADNTVDAGPRDLVGKEVAQVPRLRASVNLQHDGWLQTGLRLRQVSAQFDDDRNQRRLDAYTTLDLQLSRQIQPGVVVAISAENLLDAEYAVAESGNGLLTQGMPRLWMASMRLTLE